MEATVVNCSASVGADGDFPVNCSEEVLLPFFRDESVQTVMDPSLGLDARAPPALPELRLVLLGRKRAGKSAAGDTILGGAGGFQSGKPTEECVTRWADVAGRKLTVVDTPGWEWYYPLNSTPDWVRRETLRSVSLCPPGPHAVLLVVRSCAMVTEDYVREIEEHLELLGKGVWDHTMVLFTRGDELGLATMEQRISASGPTLRGLLRKCGGRYHVVDNRGRGDAAQVEELMAKLEDMVAGGGRFLETDNAALEGLEADRRRRAREQRKKQRQMEEHMQTVTIKAALMNDDLQGSELDAHQSFSKVPRRLPEVRLVLLGERETGKSSAGNSILGRPGSFRAGAATEECARRQAEVAMRLVTVVDTPGWEAGFAGGTMERVKREICASVGLCPPGPHALLLALRVDTLVASGHVRDHLELLSAGAWRHTLLLFTHGDQLREGVDIEQHVQAGGRDLRWLLEKCRGRYHVMSSPDGGGRGEGCLAEAAELLRKVEKMAVANRCEAFSGLVYEVRALSQQKNEKFGQLARSMGDKLRQVEAELRMREQEVRSIRWFFERKKKGKSRKKAGVREEEEDEDGRSGEQRTDYRELEERIRWLTEDKEREIQDLIVEKERIHVTLSKSRKEGEDAEFRLELRQRELEELKERLEEQQLKMLNLERASVEREHERKRRDESVEAMKREWTENVQSLKTEMEEWKTQQREAERKTHEAQMAMAELEQRRGELEAKLFEKERREEELRQEAQGILEKVELRERQAEIRAEEMRSQHETVVQRMRQDGKVEVAALKLQHREEMDRKSSEMREIEEEHRKELEAIGKQEQEKEREVAELKRTFANQAERQAQAKVREMRELEERYRLQIERKALESKENEMIQMNCRKEMTEKIREKEEEIELLKQQHQEEKERRIEEVRRFEEQRVKDMETELEKEYTGKIRGVEEDSRRQLEEMRQQFEREIEKGLQERQRQEKYTLELEERVTESEKAGAAMAESHKKSILRHLQEREAHVDELKRAHAGEIRDKTREFREEKERIATALQLEGEKTAREKEAELEEVRLGLEEMTRKLRRAEAERRDVEERGAKQRGEAEVMNERLAALERQLRTTAEERSADERRARERLEEKDGVIQDLNQRIKEAKRKEEEGENKLKEGEGELEEARQLLKEKEGEIEGLKQQAERREVEWRDERRRKDSETNAAAELVDQKTREIAEVRRLLAEREREADEARAEGASHAEAARGLEQSIKDRDAALLLLRGKDAEAGEEAREREEEIRRLRREDAEKEKELALLRLRIEQTKSELRDVSRRMEEEMTGMIREYEREIDRKSRIAESIAEEKDRAVEEHEVGRREVEHLRGENEKMRQEAGGLRLKLKEVSGRVQEWRQQVESRDDDLREREAQIKGLKETRDALRAELDALKERKDEAGGKIQELWDDFQVKLRQREREFSAKEEQIKEGILKREREVAEREKASARNEEALRKRGCELAGKEEALARKALALGNHQLSGTRAERGKCRRDEEEGARDGERAGEGGTLGEEREGELRRTRGEQEEEERQRVREDPFDDGEGESEGEVIEAPPCTSRGAGAQKMMIAEVKEGKEGTEGKKGKRPSEAKVMRDSRFLSEGRGHNGRSDLRVMVLGESWSPSAPDGVSILGGEASRGDGSTFGHWSGQVAGRRLRVVEPLGLRWRDGPGPDGAAQRRSVLDGAARCPPDVLLLLLPAFLTCTPRLRSAVEEQAGWLGAGAWRRALLLFTWGETLGESAEQHVLRNGELRALVEKCEGRYHMVTSNNSNSQVEGLLEKMEDMLALNRC